MRNNLDEIKIENIIWIIYIFLSIFALISNYYESKYQTFQIFQDKQKYRCINIAIFEVALIIYLYFLYVHFKHINNQNKYSYISTFGSILFVVAGAIFLYCEVKTAQEENIGFI